MTGAEAHWEVSRYQSAGFRFSARIESVWPLPLPSLGRLRGFNTARTAFSPVIAREKHAEQKGETSHMTPWEHRRYRGRISRRRVLIVKIRRGPRTLARSLGTISVQGVNPDLYTFYLGGERDVLEEMITLVSHSPEPSVFLGADLKSPGDVLKVTHRLVSNTRQKCGYNCGLLSRMLMTRITTVCGFSMTRLGRRGTLRQA